MSDILRGAGFVLAAYYASITPEQAALLEKLAAALRSAYGRLVRVVVISAGEAETPALIGATVLRDADGAFATAYGAQPETCYLVRPDGYIGYCARPMAEHDIRLYLDEIGLRACVI